jgi:hypothetical protein
LRDRAGSLKSVVVPPRVLPRDPMHGSFPTPTTRPIFRSTAGPRAQRATAKGSAPLLFQQRPERLARIEADGCRNIEVFQNVEPAVLSRALFSPPPPQSILCACSRSTTCPGVDGSCAAGVGRPTVGSPAPGSPT